MTRAADAAGGPGLTYISPGHVLLAVVHPEEETLAAQALRSTGVDHDKPSATFKRHMEEANTSVAEGPYRGASTTPATHDVMGRAEGIAIGLGESEVSAEHLLVALLWDRHRHVSWLLGKPIRAAKPSVTRYAH